MASATHENEHSSKHTGKQNAGGEPKKTAKALHEDETRDRQSKIDVGEGHDNKRGNIGPSGQGQHRGRESRTHQANASGGTPRH